MGKLAVRALALVWLAVTRGGGRRVLLNFVIARLYGALPIPTSLCGVTMTSTGWEVALREPELAIDAALSVAAVRRSP